MKTDYLAWMASETPSRWNNDSADHIEIEEAEESGAVGVTTNPPLTHAVLSQYSELYRNETASMDSALRGDDRVLALIGIVVRRIAKRFTGLFHSSGGKIGFVRAQVNPMDSADKASMLAMGLEFASWGENIKVKIPGTRAGIWVLEELASRGIPTNPTVCVSVSQILAAAEANERGRVRAMKSGIPPADSTAAFVMGRLQDYLSVLNRKRNLGLSDEDIESAMIAAAKRTYNLMTERGYEQRLMPAAFRSAKQVAQLAGAKVEMTIHPKIQLLINQAEAAGEIERSPGIDEPIDKAAVQRVSEAIPEFRKAYTVEGLSIDEFDTFGAAAMTLEGFSRAWQMLRTL